MGGGGRGGDQNESLSLTWRGLEIGGFVLRGPEGRRRFFPSSGSVEEAKPQLLLGLGAICKVSRGACHCCISIQEKLRFLDGIEESGANIWALRYGLQLLWL